MKKYAGKVLNWFLIIFFLVLGFIGLALPLVPQVLFFVIAFILLSFEFPEAEDWLKRKFGADHQFFKIYDKIKIYLEKYLKF